MLNIVDARGFCKMLKTSGMQKIVIWVVMLMVMVDGTMCTTLQVVVLHLLYTPHQHPRQPRFPGCLF
jgi:hypothetical protein